MPRVILQRAAAGYRAVRGEAVRHVQVALERAGLFPFAVDGVYGDDTEVALKGFQRARGLDATGKLTDDTWTTLMSEPIPVLRDRCLQLTGDFNGHGFRKVAGNFDGAGLTWGIIGFTLRHGEMQQILAAVHQHHPVLFAAAFGGLKEQLLQILQRRWNEQLDWADSISLGTNRYRVERPWDLAFSALGTFPEVQAIQLDRVARYWEIAERDAARFGLDEDSGFALCFDLAVQDGGIDFDDEERRIRRGIAGLSAATEQERRVLIADVVAENSRAQHVEDVRARMQTLATGEGAIHGVRYATRDWGLAG